MLPISGKNKRKLSRVHFDRPVQPAAPKIDVTITTGQPRKFKLHKAGKPVHRLILKSSNYHLLNIYDFFSPLFLTLFFLKKAPPPLSFQHRTQQDCSIQTWPPIVHYLFNDDRIAFVRTAVPFSQNQWPPPALLLFLNRYFKSFFFFLSLAIGVWGF